MTTYTRVKNLFSKLKDMLNGHPIIFIQPALKCLLFLPIVVMVPFALSAEQNIHPCDAEDVDKTSVAVYIVLQNLANFRTNWIALKKETGVNFVLIRNAHIDRPLRPEEVGGFSSIHELDDYNTDSIKKVMAEYVNKYGSQNLRILTNDEYAILFAGKMRDIFQIPGPSEKDMLPYRDKVVMKQQLTNSGILLPRYVPFAEAEWFKHGDSYLQKIAAYIKFPSFAKPVDGASAVGCAKIHNFQELQQWALNHDRSAEYEIDEFIPGVLYHCDVLVDGDRITFRGTGWHTNTCFDFTLGHEVCITYLDTSHPDWKPIFEAYDRILNSFSCVPNGAYHLELIKRDAKQWYFLEIGARTAGSVAPEAYQKMWGFNLEEAHFKLQMGLSPKIPTHQFAYASIILYPKKTGTVLSINSPQVKANCQRQYMVKVKDVVKKAPDGLFGCAARFVVWHQDQQILEESTKQLYSFEPISYCHE